MRTLHWVLITSRIDLKIILFVYKSLHDEVPISLSELLHPYTPSRSLRSSDQSVVLFPNSRLKRRGDSVFWPQLWNNLPLEIRLALSLTTCMPLLKTYNVPCLIN